MGSEGVKHVQPHVSFVKGLRLGWRTGWLPPSMCVIQLPIDCSCCVPRPLRSGHGHDCRWHGDPNRYHVFRLFRYFFLPSPIRCLPSVSSSIPFLTSYLFYVHTFLARSSVSFSRHKIWLLTPISHTLSYELTHSLD